VAYKLSELQKTFYEFTRDDHQYLDLVGRRFAYYTSAATAIQIINNKEIWMRSTHVMNDSTEVEYGYKCLCESFSSVEGVEFFLLVDKVYPGLSRKLLRAFSDWRDQHHRSTFITCLSAHAVNPKQENDDDYGRLSMWRAYGGQDSVAFIFNGDILFAQDVDSPFKSIPVAYMEPDGTSSRIIKPTRLGLHANLRYFSGLGEAVALSSLLEMFQLAAVSIKHPAFLEEREWRVVVTGGRERIYGIEREIAIIGGVPQHVIKIPLRDNPERNLQGLSLDHLIDKILIGPCEYPAAVESALLHALENAQVLNPEVRIKRTNIPLRKNQR
jgi:hypothetical protein